MIVRNGNSIRQVHPRRLNNLAFLKGFLRRPELIGSIVPSSRFLERRLIASAFINQARLVVELGPGTGGTTRAILDALPPTSKLLAIEITPEFIPLLKSCRDSRLIVHPGSAEHIRQALATHELSNPDVVVSGIPFSTMPADLGRRILSAVWSCLPPGGRFIAYQFRDKVALLGRPLLGKPETVLELLNVPPTRIFHWQKPIQAEGH